VISVVLPYRNSAATLAAAIDSTLADPACGELIAVDDGSSDEGPAIVASRALRDARVVRLSSGGRGVAQALSAGVSVARGDFIGRMDADDVSLPGRLAVARELCEKSPDIAVAAVAVEAFPSPGPGLVRYLAWQNGLVTPQDHARDMFVEAPVCHPSVVIRRSALEAVGGYRPSDGPEDYDLWLRLDAAGFRLAKSERVLFRWRHHDSRVTMTDPRCSLSRIRDLRARFLALRLGGRPFVVWGAGQTGKRLARALEAEGRSPSAFIDIDPDKIGRKARDKPILGREAAIQLGLYIVVAVGAQGARDEIRSHLYAANLRDPHDFVCAA
jgi:glycosyltransferase involved in cell wall biosynthesis